MELYCATSDVKSTGGDKQAPPSVDLTTNALPEVQKPATATNLQTGVSTNNVLSKTSVDTNKDTKDTPHWYALRTTYGREKKAYDYLLSKNVVAFYPTLKSVKLVDSKRITVEETHSEHLLCIRHRRRIKGFCLRQRKPPLPPLLLSTYSRWQQDCQDTIGRTRKPNEQPKDNLCC